MRSLSYRGYGASMSIWKMLDMLFDLSFDILKLLFDMFLDVSLRFQTQHFLQSGPGGLSSFSTVVYFTLFYYRRLMAINRDT